MTQYNHKGSAFSSISPQWHPSHSSDLQDCKQYIRVTLGSYKFVVTCLSSHRKWTQCPSSEVFSLHMYFQPPHKTDPTVHNILNEYIQIIFYWTTASKRRIRYAADDHKEKTPVWSQLQSRTLTRQPPRSPLALFPPQTQHLWTCVHGPVFLFMNFLNETAQHVHNVLFSIVVRLTHGCPRWLSDKASTCQVADTGLISGSERPPGEGNGNPLQFFCLGNPMGGTAWRTTVHGVTEESDTT